MWPHNFLVSATSSTDAVASSTYLGKETSDDEDSIFVERSHEGNLVPKEDTDSLTFSMIKGYFNMTNESNGKWNDNADGVLCLMKTKDWSWTMIANVLGHKIEDTKERFKYLTSLAKEDGGVPTDVIGELYFLKMRRHPELLEGLAAKGAAFEEAISKLDNRGAHGNMLRTRILAKASKSQKSWLAKLSPNKDLAEGLDIFLELRSQAPSPAPTLTPAAAAPPPTAPPAAPAAEAPKAGGAQAPRSAKEVDHFYVAKGPLVSSFAREHPALKKLDADDNFTAWDCKALAALEARQRDDKWLHLAADFANMTGRAVAPEVIKAKLEGAPVMGKEEAAGFYGLGEVEGEGEGEGETS